MFTYDTKYIEYSGDEYIHKGTKKKQRCTKHLGF